MIPAVSAKAAAPMPAMTPQQGNVQGMMPNANAAAPAMTPQQGNIQGMMPNHGQTWGNGNGFVMGGGVPTTYQTMGANGMGTQQWGMQGGTGGGMQQGEMANNMPNNNNMQWQMQLLMQQNQQLQRQLMDQSAKATPPPPVAEPSKPHVTEDKTEWHGDSWGDAKGWAHWWQWSESRSSDSDWWYGSSWDSTSTKGNGWKWQKDDGAEQEEDEEPEKPATKKRRMSGKTSIDLDNHVMVPDRNHLDSTTVYEMKLPKQVQSSKWNDSLGISGRDPTEVYLWEVLKHKKNAYALRLIANARYVKFEACKSSEEQQLVQALLMRMRHEDCPVKLNHLLKTTAKSMGISLDTWEEKAQAWNRVADDLIKSMHGKCMGAEVESKDATLAEMAAMLKEAQAENQRLRAANGTSASSASSAREEANDTDTFMKQFERANNCDKVLERLQIQGLDPKVTKAKIEGLCLPKEKTDKMNSLADELIGRLLRRSSKNETIQLQSKIEALTVQWGLKQTVVSGAQNANDYKTLARLLAVAMVLEQ